MFVAADHGAAAQRDVSRIPLIGPFEVLDAAGPASDIAPFSTVRLGLYCAVGLLFVVAGTHIRLRRASSRIGVLLVVAGVLWLLQGLRRSSDPALFTVGSLLVDAQVPVLIHAILGFPSGRLSTAADRWAVIGAYLYWTPCHALAYTVVDYRARIGGTTPQNLLLVTDDAGIAGALHGALFVGDAMLGAVVLVMLTRRLRDGSAAFRWSFRPLWYGALGALAAAALALATGAGAELAAWNVYVVGCAAVPVAFWVAMSRGRRARRLVMAEVLPSSGSSLTWSLRYLLHDPSLEVVVGPAPQTPHDRAVTVLTRGGRQVGALLHDPAAHAEPELLAAAAAAAAVAVENQTLLATVSAQLAETQESRRRIVQAVAEERLRIERNLHDGAQQRLLATALLLRRGQRRPDLPADAEAVIDAAAGQIELALDEVRALARGLYPPSLVSAGLVRAVQDLAEGSTSVAVEVTAPATVEAPLPVSAMAYFTVLEGVTNAVRHARARSVHVTITVDESDLVVDVTDDGTGGVRMLPAGGLLGLHDRISALGGRLELASRAGDGSTVTARLPLDVP